MHISLFSLFYIPKATTVMNYNDCNERCMGQKRIPPIMHFLGGFVFLGCLICIQGVGVWIISVFFYMYPMVASIIVPGFSWALW